MSKSNKYSNLIAKMQKLDEENKWLREERETLEDELEVELEEAMIAAECLKSEKEYFKLKSKKLETKIKKYEEEMRKKVRITKDNIPSIEYKEDIVRGIKIVDATMSEDFSVVNHIGFFKTPIMQEDSQVNIDVQKHVIISSSTAFPFYGPNPDRIPNVTDADVLCGKGGRGTTNWHVGNMYYRSLCKEYQLEYMQAIKGLRKNYIVNKILDMIKNKGGRFLRKDEFTGIWMKIGDVKASAKTKQALREGLSELRKKQTVREGLSELGKKQTCTQCIL